MAEYRIETLEKFEARAVYYTEADSAEDAIAAVRAGYVAYDFHEHTGEDDEFVEVVSIETL